MAEDGLLHAQWMDMPLERVMSGMVMASAPRDVSERGAEIDLL